MENLTSIKTEGKKEIDGMKSDLILLNNKSQKAEGIINFSESDFKSEYGRKRYGELKSIQESKNVRFNKDEIEIIANEMESMIKNKEEDLKNKEEKDDKRKDLEMLNKNINSSKGILNLSESDFKSEYGRKRYQELKSIQEGKNVRFNKDELEIIAKELEDFLSENKNKKIEKVEEEKQDEENINEKEDKKYDDVENEIVDNTEQLAKDNAKQKYLENAKKKMGVVNVDEIAEAEARKAADAYMTESKENLKGFKNIFKRIWKHTFFDEYYRQRQIARTREEIKNSGNIYVGRLDNKDKIAHENAMKGISDRFTSEYEETLSKGEAKKEINNSDPEFKQANSEIKDLINDYASGNLTKEVFNTSKDRILKTLKNKDLLGSMDTYTDNIFEIAENARLAIEHGAKLEELELDTNMIIGKAKSSLKTEAHFNAVDKVVDKMKKSQFGRFISPAVLNTSIGLAYSISVGMGVKFLRSKAAAWGTFGAAVGVSTLLAGANESQRLALERAQHDIEMAEGSTYEAGSKKREHLDKFAYQTESSSELAQNLRNLMFDKDAEGKDVLKDIRPEDMDKILASLADIEARNSLNTKNRIDLISYSNIANVEKERTDLTILTARAKVELRKKITNDFQDGKIKGKTFDEYLKEQTETIENSLLGGEAGITAQDKAFSKFKTKEVAKKMLMTAVVGLTIGATVQEGIAFFKDDIQGLTEGVFNLHSDAGPITQTPLEHLRSWITGDSTHVPMGNPMLINLDGHELAFAEGTTIIENGDGSINILRGGNVISENFTPTYDSSGALDEASLVELGKDGIIATTTCNVIEGTKEVITNANDYIDNHHGSTHRISRDLWYGNDTPMYPDPNNPGHLLGADLNEIKGHWGGVGGSGVDENGNIVLNHSRMTSDGSFHKEFSVDVTEKIKAGELKIILSLTQGTQNDVFEVPIGTDGNAVIDPNSEIGKLFFGVDENGHAVFKGRFAEVIESMGTKDGSEHVRVISTLVGPGNDSITDVVSTTVEVPTTNIIPSVDTQPPMFIPIMSRKPLEKLKEEKYIEKKENDDIKTIDYLYSGFSDIKREDYRYRMSESLKNNPEATLDEKKEISDYLSRQDKDHYKNIEELASEAGPMRKDCKLSVCIPVAGHQEEKVIYKTLENYLNQTADKNNFEIVLFVNYPDKDKSGKEIIPDGTISEIKRFTKDHPEINVSMMHKVIPFEKVKIGYIRKLLNDAILKRNLDRGYDAPSHVMLSNDADNKGISFDYINNFINKFEKNPNVDSYMGQLDWDPESYIRNPLIHIGTRLFQYSDMQIRHKNIPSSGANFAFRSSIYAAVNGYSLDIGLAEDVDLGKAIKAARIGSKDKKAIDFAGALVSRLFTSSRRAEKAIKDGLSPVEQWEDGFSAFDDEVRKIDWPSLSNSKEIDYNDKEQVKLLVNQLENVINRTINAMKWLRGDFKIFKRSLGWLGIKFEIVDKNNIKIIDASKLIKGLEKYQKEGLEILKRKTGELKNNQINKTEYVKNIEINKDSIEINKEINKNKEIISIESIEKIIKDQLNSSGRIENINKFNLAFIGDRLMVDGDINGKGIAGNIKIKGSLKNNGEMIALGKDLDIKANLVTKPIIKNNLDKVIPKIKEHFEEQYKKEIKSMKIENGGLVLDFKE